MIQLSFMNTMRYDLWYAVSQQSYEEVLSWLMKRADANSQWGGNTVLCIASAKGRTNIVELLLSYGADINRDSCMITPLMEAVQNDRKDTVAFLLKRGADPNMQNASGDTCLHMVKDIDIATLLLEMNCDLTLVDGGKLTAKEYNHKIGRYDIVNLIEQYEMPLIKEPEGN